MPRNVFSLQDEKFKDFLLNIKSIFCSSNYSIHKARNEIKIIKLGAEEIIVKSFKIPNFINRILYLFGKKTKAQKSYEYALKIVGFTPEPIGFINFYSPVFLNESFLVTKNFHYDFTIREVLLNVDFQYREKILKKFADFTYKLHQNNILHLDYSPGNILIKKLSDEYEFKIVDINRMKFKPLSVKERLKNFSKLWANDDDLKIIAEEYARLANYDKNQCSSMAIKYSHMLKAKINFKKRLKGICH